MATMKHSNANVRKRRLVFSFVVAVDDDCLDLAELLIVDDADDGGGEGLVPLPEDVGVTAVGRIDFFGIVLRISGLVTAVSTKWGRGGPGDLAGSYDEIFRGLPSAPYVVITYLQHT